MKIRNYGRGFRCVCCKVKHRTGYKIGKPQPEEPRCKYCFDNCQGYPIKCLKTKIHSFGKTNPNHKCYGKGDYRTPTCGIQVKKEFVTNKTNEVTCKLCIKLERKQMQCEDGR